MMAQKDAPHLNLVVRDNKLVLDKYKKQLTFSETKMGIIGYWAILIAPLFFIVMAALNLWTASRLSTLHGTTLSDVTGIMFMEINPKQEYPFSGMLLLIIQRLETSMFQFVFSIPLLGSAFAMYIERNRNREILKVLRKHGEI